jgi:hypothetical protein
MNFDPLVTPGSDSQRQISKTRSRISKLLPFFIKEKHAFF